MWPWAHQIAWIQSPDCTLNILLHTEACNTLLLLLGKPLDERYRINAIYGSNENCPIKFFIMQYSQIATIHLEPITCQLTGVVMNTWSIVGLAPHEGSADKDDLKIKRHREGCLCCAHSQAAQSRGCLHVLHCPLLLWTFTNLLVSSKLLLAFLVTNHLTYGSCPCYGKYHEGIMIAHEGQIK